MRRGAGLVVGAALALCLNVHVALAEPTDSGSGSVQVGPQNEGTTVSQGVGSYDSQGT